MTKCILLVYLLPLLKESYVVTYVQGTVVVKRGTTQDTLRSKSKIFDTDSIKFLNSPALIRVACSQGTFYMKEEGLIRTASYTRSGSFWKNVKSSLLPTPKKGEMKSRGFIGNAYEAIPFFRQFENDSSAMTILGSRRIEVNKDYFADTANRFFYLAWEHNGEVINKMIPWEKKEGKLYLVLDDGLFKVDNRPVNISSLSGRMNFFDKKELVSTDLSAFVIKKYKPDELNDEICLVIEGITDGKPASQLTPAQKTQISDYFFSRVGNVDGLVIDDKFINQIKCKQ